MRLYCVNFQIQDQQLSSYRQYFEAEDLLSCALDCLWVFATKHPEFRDARITLIAEQSEYDRISLKPQDIMTIPVFSQIGTIGRLVKEREVKA